MRAGAGGGRLGPGDLARALAALPVDVAALECASGLLALPDYPDEPRPTTIVTLSGGGQVGFGENVAFTRAAHATFVRRLAGSPATAGTVGQLTEAFAARLPDDPHGRAAVEAALIDLALRQARLSLARLCEADAGTPLRQVWSFAARPDAAVHARAQLAADPARRFKIDVDPSWSDADLAELAQLPRDAIAVFDFKDRGDSTLAARLSHLCPGALFEDPPAGTVHPHIARDRSLSTPLDVAEAAQRGEAVNLKAPRMGGPLAVLAGLHLARERGVLAYLGGMFEVGPGRQQARQLAALFCPASPNDLAPIAGALGSAPRAGAVLGDVPGFGATFDWGRALRDAGLELA
jgi:L-alanine-DL-glutamate epimerase-like enolase superfamily enzyme